MWKEFKEFAFRGNVLDMAIGVIIGGAFSGIVSAVVTLITELITAMTNGVEFSSLSFTIGSINVAYGPVVQAIFNFLVIAVSIFFMVKAINKMHKKKEEEPAPAAPAGPTTEELLAEIRDLLKNK